jgi:WD40 repeat protein
LASEPTFGTPPDPHAVTGASGTPLDLTHRALPAISGYEILGQLGRGAMGVVYHAREVRLNRPCAIKMILAGAHASPEARVRFLVEAEAVAKLHHPNVVQIYRIGEAGGLPFLELEYVEGGSLAAALDGTPWPARRAAALVESLACAIAAAHGRGLVHRDLKPANVLLSVEGAPKIIDFGLAKVMAADSRLTATGLVLGTPSYMAPEQAEGHTEEVGPAVDTYALGAILYELLTGRPPFKGATVLETLELVKQTEPVPPSRLAPGLPRDVETICLKCLEKDPRRRYASAAALAEDLERYLRGEPILARRTGSVERTIKWARRRPAIATLLALVQVVALAGLLGILWQWRRAEDQRDRAVLARNDAVEARKLADDRRLEAQRRSTRLALDRGLALCQQGEVGQGMLWLARTLELAPPEEADLVRVARTNLSGWRRRLAPLQAILQHGGEVAALSPDRTRLLTGRNSPDGRTGEAQLWDVATRQPIGPPLKHDAGVRWVDFSPDAATFLTIAGEQIRLWDAATGTPKGEIIPIPSSHIVSFSPEGKAIESTVPANLETSRLYDAATGKPFGRLLTHKGDSYRSAFSPDGNVLVIASQDGSAQIWDAHTGEPKGEPLWRDIPLPAASMVFSPDGKTLMARDLLNSGGATRFRWWALAQRKVIGPAVQPHGVVPVESVSWSRDNKTILTASWDRTARLWDAATGKPRIAPLPHQAPVHLACFSPDEKLILTACHDTTARLWDAATGEPVSPYLRHPDRVQAAWFSPDGQTILTTSRDGTLHSWEVAANRPIGSFRAHSADAVCRLDLADDVGLASTWDKQHESSPALIEVRLWSVATRQPLGPPLQKGTSLLSSLSPDGRTVLTGLLHGDVPVRLWDVATGRPRGEPIPIEGELWWAGFHPHSTTFATCVVRQTPSGLICEGRLWETTSGRPLRTLFTFPSKNWHLNLAFSPDGQTILVEEAQGVARLWDCTTHQPLGPFIKQNVAIRSMAFHPDGKTVLTGGDDSVARLWNVATGQLLDELPFDTPGWTDSVAFSPDGRRFLTATFDRTTWGGRREESARPPAGATRLWDTATRLPLGAPFDQGGAWSAAFSRDGTIVLTGCRDGQVRFWRVPAPLDGEVERISLWVQVSTGLELTAEGRVVVLDADSWRDRNRHLEELGGPPIR